MSLTLPEGEILRVSMASRDWWVVTHLIKCKGEF